MHARSACTALVLLVASSSALARTALTPAPVRDDANLQLGDRGHLVNEVRTVGLLKGTNTVAFSWKNVAIDAASLRLNTLEGDGVRLIGFTFPPGEAGAVLAEVYADKDTVARFRVSYLLGNIQRDTGYQGVLDREGKSWRIRREVTVFNRSGERFTRVDVSLGSGLGYAGPLEHPEGRKVLADTPSAVPSRRIYRVRLTEMEMVGGAPRPLNPELFYVLANDATLNPSKDVLLPGKMRMFQLDKAGTQAFLGEDALPAVAHGREVEVRGGGANDVRVRWFLEQDEERNQVKARHSAQEPTTFVVRADRYRRYRIEVKNFKDEAVQVWATIPVDIHTGVTVQKSSFPATVEHHHTDGVLVKIDAPGGGKETTGKVELLFPDYVFNTH